MLKVCFVLESNLTNPYVLEDWVAKVRKRKLEVTNSRLVRGPV